VADFAALMAVTLRPRMVPPVPTGRYRQILPRDPHRRAIRLQLRVIVGTTPHRLIAVRLRLAARLRLRTRRRDPTQRRARVSRLRTPPVEASLVHVQALREDIREALAGMGAAGGSREAGGHRACE
jgi:hypothetical protein